MYSMEIWPLYLMLELYSMHIKDDQLDSIHIMFA